MKRADLPYLTKKTVKGRVYWYFRRAGVYAPLPDIDAPDFLQKYEAAKRGGPSEPRPSAKTWRNLIASYKQTPGYKNLAARTKADYEKVFDWVLATMPDLDPTKMLQPHIIKARDANADRRRFATYIIQVLKILFSRAVEMGWMTHNPAKGVKPLPKPKHEEEVHRPWPLAAQEAYRAAAPHGSAERTSFELALGLSQRISDTLALRWDQWGPEGFEIRQSKTATALVIPPTQALADYLNAMERRSATIVTGIRGNELGYSGGYQAFRDARKRAADKALEDGDERLADLIMTLTQHGLRYTVASEMGAAGASDDEIAAVTGHKTTAMLRKYAGAERQKARAKAGQSKRNRP